MQLLGPIIRLQVQRASLKLGERPLRRYDPAPLLAVPRVELNDGGVTLRNGDGPLLDVHHRDHPAGKNAGVNGISIGFSAHYDAMRERFGSGLPDGIAGENILVETGRLMTEDDLKGGVVVVTRQGTHVHITDILVAEPCVEFTRFALGYAPVTRSEETVTAGLQSLRGGVRGFYARYAGDPVTVEVGDRVFLG